MPTIIQESQSASPTGEVSLFTLDATSIGGNLMHFVQGNKQNTAVSFGGTIYQPVDIEFTGLETTGAGALPTPTIRISNTDGLPQAIINTFGDLLGCKLYRHRTFVRFLDGEPDADPTAFFGPDIFLIERKASENIQFIEWDLSTNIDQHGKQLPGRQVIRNTCLHRYRAYNPTTGKFDYTRAQCPYAGTNYFDINDQPVTQASEDKPSRRKNCCAVRFGKENPWPFGGYPGVTRQQ